MARVATIPLLGRGTNDTLATLFPPAGEICQRTGNASNRVTLDTLDTLDTLFHPAGEICQRTGNASNRVTLPPLPPCFPQPAKFVSELATPQTVSPSTPSTPCFPQPAKFVSELATPQTVSPSTPSTPSTPCFTQPEKFVRKNVRGVKSLIEIEKPFRFRPPFRKVLPRKGDMREIATPTQGQIWPLMW